VGKIQGLPLLSSLKCSPLNCHKNIKHSKSCSKKVSHTNYSRHSSKVNFNGFENGMQRFSSKFVGFPLILGFDFGVERENKKSTRRLHLAFKNLFISNFNKKIS
jgi:hypothetical protein